MAEIKKPLTLLAIAAMTGIFAAVGSGENTSWMGILFILYLVLA